MGMEVLLCDAGNIASDSRLFTTINLVDKIVSLDQEMAIVHPLVAAEVRRSTSTPCWQDHGGHFAVHLWSQIVRHVRH